MEHGYAPASQNVLFQVEWFYATIYDKFEKPERFAIMRDETTEESRQACITLLSNLADVLEARFADGSVRVCAALLSPPVQLLGINDAFADLGQASSVE